jgi:hypothetical protein
MTTKEFNNSVSRAVNKGRYIQGGSGYLDDVINMFEAMESPEGEQERVPTLDDIHDLQHAICKHEKRISDIETVLSRQSPPTPLALMGLIDKLNIRIQALENDTKSDPFPEDMDKDTIRISRKLLEDYTKSPATIALSVEIEKALKMTSLCPACKEMRCG